MYLNYTIFSPDFLKLFYILGRLKLHLCCNCFWYAELLFLKSAVMTCNPLQGCMRGGTQNTSKNYEESIQAKCCFSNLIFFFLCITDIIYTWLDVKCSYPNWKQGRIWFKNMCWFICFNQWSRNYSIVVVGRKDIETTWIKHKSSEISKHKAVS